MIPELTGGQLPELCTARISDALRPSAWNVLAKVIFEGGWLSNWCAETGCLSLCPDGWSDLAKVVKARGYSLIIEREIQPTGEQESGWGIFSAGGATFLIR